jgi:uncharacterized protein DUF3726
MMVSRNEIESLALKAARGAGMSWGLAEEAAIAAGWLAGHGLPWAGTLACTLAGMLADTGTTSAPLIEGQTIGPSRAGTRLCPIQAGAYLSDLGPPAAAMEVRDLLAPLWLAPFLASWSGPARAVRLSWEDADVLVGLDTATGTDGSGASLSAPFATRVAIASEPAILAPRRQPLGRASGYDAPDEAWRALQQLEHRTYVPASTQSRLAGAGAGLLDND